MGHELIVFILGRNRQPVFKVLLGEQFIIDLRLPWDFSFLLFGLDQLNQHLSSILLLPRLVKFVLGAVLLFGSCCLFRRGLIKHL